MDVETVKSEKNELRLKFSEIDQGFLNFIKSAVWEDSATQMAGFNIDHPMVGHPTFILKTKGKSAKDVWNKALESANKQISTFESQIKKLK